MTALIRRLAAFGWTLRECAEGYELLGCGAPSVFGRLEAGEHAAGSGGRADELLGGRLMTHYACTCGHCNTCRQRQCQDRKHGRAPRPENALTVPEAAALLCVARNTMHYYLTGEWDLPILPSVRRRERGQRFIYRADLIAWLDATDRWTTAARKELGR